MKPVGNNGRSAPFRATLDGCGVNSTLCSRNASGTQLLLCNRLDDPRPVRAIHMDQAANRTCHYGHVFAPRLRPGQIDGYQADGPVDPPNGMRFDGDKLLLDPYGRGVVVPDSYDRNASRGKGANVAAAMKSAVIDSSTYNREGDTPLKRPSARTIVYERRVDGFPLNDLVLYDHKHNERNGPGNRDGSDDRRSWSYGIGGPMDDPAVEKLRNREVKNFLTATLLAVGTPMMLMGDKVRPTQHGNNNGCRDDDEESEFDWTLLKKHADIHRFVRLLIGRRLPRTTKHEFKPMSLNPLLRRAKGPWHGARIGQPGWGECSHRIAFGAEMRNDKLLLHLILNTYGEPLDLELPPVENGHENPWRPWIDTALDSPHDIVDWRSSPPVSGYGCPAEARSVVVFFAALE